MSPRTSSSATTATSRKPRGSAAVTPAAPSGSIERPVGDGRASRRSGKAVSANRVATPAKSSAKLRSAAPKPARAAVGTRASRAKVADLPSKKVTTFESPTRSIAKAKTGAKEDTAVKKIQKSATAAQVTRIVTVSVPTSVLGEQQPPAVAVSKAKAVAPKAILRSAGKLSKPEEFAQVSAAAQVPSEKRAQLASAAAIGATTHNVDLLGPIVRYVGLDIGNTTELCEVRQEKVTARATVRKDKELEALLAPGTGRARVVLEACRQAWYLHDLLTGWGHEVWVVDTTRVRQLGIGQHKRKNDRIDAEVLARAGESGRVPRAHVLSHASQRLRMQLGVRRALVETRAQYVGTIRSMLRSEGLVVPSCDVEAFVGKLKATGLPPAVHDVIKPMVVALEAIGPQIEKVDEQLDKLCAEQPVVQLLSSAPGVGRIVSAAYVSVIDNPGRFRNAHQVEAYLGLVPSESTSGKRKLGAITKQGNAYLRAMLVQAAWNVLRQRATDPVKSWGLALAKKRGKRVAVVAIARRLAGILWAMWRNNTCYDRSKVGQSSARGKRQEAKRTTVVAATIEAAAVIAT